MKVLYFYYYRHVHHNNHYYYYYYYYYLTLLEASDTTTVVYATIFRKPEFLPSKYQLAETLFAVLWTQTMGKLSTAERSHKTVKAFKSRIRTIDLLKQYNGHRLQWLYPLLHVMFFLPLQVLDFIVDFKG